MSIGEGLHIFSSVLCAYARTPLKSTHAIDQDFLLCFTLPPTNKEVQRPCRKTTSLLERDFAPVCGKVGAGFPWLSWLALKHWVGPKPQEHGCSVPAELRRTDVPKDGVPLVLLKRAPTWCVSTWDLKLTWSLLPLKTWLVITQNHGVMDPFLLRVRWRLQVGR